jgi:hypothetical protein
LAVFQTRPAIVEQSVGVEPPLLLPEEPELLVDPELEEVDPLVEPLPEELLVDPPVLLLVEPELELLLAEPELLLVDPELLPELPPEELDPPDEPEPDVLPLPNSVEPEPPHAPTALRGIETARHTNRKRACIGVLLQEPMRSIASLVPSGDTGLFFGTSSGIPPATQVSQPGCASPAATSSYSPKHVPIVFGSRVTLAICLGSTEAAQRLPSCCTLWT